MMNIQSTAQTGLLDAAALASMTIASSCFHLLPSPIRSVVRRMTSFPCRISAATPMFRFPTRKTLSITECQCPPCPCRTRYFGTACQTQSRCVTFPSRRFGADKSTYERMCHTLACTILTISPAQSICWTPVERRSTGVTYEIIRYALRWFRQRSVTAFFVSAPLEFSSCFYRNVRHGNILPRLLYCVRV